MRFFAVHGGVGTGTGELRRHVAATYMSYIRFHSLLAVGKQLLIDSSVDRQL